MKTNSFKYKIKFLILKYDIIEGRQLNSYNWLDPILKFWNSSVNIRTIFLSTTIPPTGYSCESISSILTFYHQWTTTIALWKVRKRIYYIHTRYLDWKNCNLNIQYCKYNKYRIHQIVSRIFCNYVLLYKFFQETEVFFHSYILLCT